MPGTATGTVLCNAVTVARAISSGVYFFLQSKPKYILLYLKSIKIFFFSIPAVTIFGLSNVPSKKT
jgi:hypothetical protein